MKSLLFAAALLIPATLFAAPPAQAPLQAPGKAVQAPMQAPAQAPVQAPNKMGTAQQPGAYRTFSYEPGYQPASMNYGAASFGGTYYGNGYLPAPARTGFHDAGWKVRGNF
jgi:hypothetical protein